MLHKFVYYSHPFGIENNPTDDMDVYFLQIEKLEMWTPSEDKKADKGTK